LLYLALNNFAIADYWNIMAFDIQG
jgi:hypothetical protein